MRFWDFQSNCSQTTCRTTLIFLPLARAMSEPHFSYLGHAHISSRKFSRRTWKKVFVKKSTFFKVFSRIFWLFKILKEAFFWGEWNELFGPDRLDLSIIVVWPGELMSLIGNCLENIFITYHVVIRRPEKFLRVCEVQIQIFWHLKKHENQHDLSIFYIVW